MALYTRKRERHRPSVWALPGPPQLQYLFNCLEQFNVLIFPTQKYNYPQFLQMGDGGTERINSLLNVTLNFSCRARAENQPLIPGFVSQSQEQLSFLCVGCMPCLVGCQQRRTCSCLNAAFIVCTDDQGYYVCMKAMPMITHELLIVHEPSHNVAMIKSLLSYFQSCEDHFCGTRLDPILAFYSTWPIDAWPPVVAKPEWANPCSGEEAGSPWRSILAGALAPCPKRVACSSLQ